MVMPKLLPPDDKDTAKVMVIIVIIIITTFIMILLAAVSFGILILGLRVNSNRTSGAKRGKTNWRTAQARLLGFRSK